MKKIITLTALFTMLFSVNAVEWPVEDKAPDSIISYFGQNVGGNISKSIIFANPKPVKDKKAQDKNEEIEIPLKNEVKAVKEGKILIIMTELDDDSELFPSALGTSVILAHDDDIISVYANLETQSVQLNTQNKNTIAEGEVIGDTGNTGWQEAPASLEFQIIDNQNSAAINPKILLPRTEKEIDYSLSGIMLQNKSGTFYDLRESKIFPAGTYKVYHTRNKTAMPYKLTCAINGVIEDEIFFDTITYQNGKLYLSGKEKRYNSEVLYADETLLLTGELTLTPGKSTLGITAETFLGKQKQLNYILSIY